MNWIKYDIEPMGKPRMTQRDRWKKRPKVVRYHAFKDGCRAAKIELPEKLSVIFHISMPRSWSKKKLASMAGQPHRQVPDIDNLLKALLDACLDDDAHIWSVQASKFWSTEGCIEIEQETGAYD